MAGGAVWDRPDARIGQSLPTHCRQGQGGPVWFGGKCGRRGGSAVWSCFVLRRRRHGEEIRRKVAENGVDVEALGEAQVELVGQEILSIAKIVVSLTEALKNRLGLRERQAQKRVYKEWVSISGYPSKAREESGKELLLHHIPSQPRFLHKQSSWWEVTINSAYFSTSASSISEGTRTGTSLPSTVFLFTPTTSSLLQRVQRTRSLPWQTQPLLAHSISPTLSGLGAQSVSSWKLARRLRSCSLSAGEYFGWVSLAATLVGVHFRRTTLDMVVAPLTGWAPLVVGMPAWVVGGIELGWPIRRFLARKWRSLTIVETSDEAADASLSVASGGEALFSGDEEDDGRAPIPWIRALNLRLTVAFMFDVWYGGR